MLGDLITLLIIAIKIKVKSWLTDLHTTENKKDGGDKRLKRKTETEVVGLNPVFLSATGGLSV